MAKTPKLGSTRLHKRSEIKRKRGEDQAFLSKVRQYHAKDVRANEHNMDPVREDIRFVIGDQWEAEAKNRRVAANKPVLTVNRLPAFVAQYVGNWLQTDTSIKLSPSSQRHKKAAEVRQGIIRAIMRGQVGKHAVNTAMMHSYIGGVGNFSVAVEPSASDVFANDIKLKPHEDPFDVIWDRASREPSGADANHVFIFEWLTREDYEAAYPEDATCTGWPISEAAETNIVAHGWEQDELVRVCQFWQMREEPVTMGLEATTGDVIDVSDWTDDERVLKLEMDPKTAAPFMLETTRKYAEGYVLSYDKVLEGPFRLDIPRVPAFRVPGWLLYEGTVPHYWGFVRNAKDPQRLHNFWRSIMAEELRKSVNGKWLLDAASMKSGLAERFRNAHISDDNVLFWDSQTDGAKPEMIPPPVLNQAVLTEAGMTVQDIKDVTNKHEASLGLTSNEVSGKAITARQRVSELGDVIYTEHMNTALAEAGRVINELIPVVYDSARTVKILGEDDEETLQAINGELGDATPDITSGKYDVTYSTGPSYATKRQESVDIIMTLMNTMPQVGNLVADILVRNMDIPGADEIEDRLAAMLPEGMIDLEKLPAKRREKIMQRQAQQQQAQQQEQQKADAAFMAGLQKTRAEIGELAARAAKQGAQAQSEQARKGIEVLDALIEMENTRINAARVGIENAKLQTDVAMRGLEAAREVAARDEERQAEAQESQEAAQEAPQEQQAQPTDEENANA